MSINEASKIAIVTGGASGLGLAITKKLVENKIKTIIIGRNENNLKKFSDKFRRTLHL